MTELELTYPPSVNHYYTKWCQYVQKAGKHVVKMAVNDRGMAYRAEVRRFKLVDLHNPQSLKGRLSCEIQLWKPDRRKNAYDIDNFLKCLFDAITYAEIWVDDEQVDMLLVRNCGVEAPGRIIVTLRDM